MTRIIFKTAVRKEGTAGIADKKANGGIAVSGSAIGPAYVRILIDLAQTIIRQQLLPF
jgi:hypothetical protein